MLRNNKRAEKNKSLRPLTVYTLRLNHPLTYIFLIALFQLTFKEISHLSQQMIACIGTKDTVVAVGI